jgi:hypothetical protein
MFDKFPRTFGPTRLSLEQCLEPTRPQIVQDLARRVNELEQQKNFVRPTPQQPPAETQPQKPVEPEKPAETEPDEPETAAAQST